MAAGTWDVASLRKVEERIVAMAKKTPAIVGAVAVVGGLVLLVARNGR